MKDPVILTAIVLLLFWACAIPISRTESRCIVKIDDHFTIRNNGFGDTVLAFTKYTWGPEYTGGGTDTLWKVIGRKPKNIIAYPNKLFLAKEEDGHFIIIGYKDSLIDYWEFYKDKKKFIDYANKIGAPLYGTENW